MMLVNKKALAILLSIGALVIAGCGGSNDKQAAKDTKVREIKVVAAPGFFPITYANDKGEAEGYDVAVMKALDEALPQYTFKYELASKEALNVGVQSGTYQIGINSLFRSKQREETYILPKNNIGYTPVGVISRTGTEPIKSLGDIVDRKLRIHPTSTSGGIRTVLNNWNSEHPDKKIVFEMRSGSRMANELTAIQNNEFDVSVNLIPVYNLAKEDARKGTQISEPITVVPTYCIINKQEKQLAADIDAKLAELKQNGKLSELSKKYFKVDLFAIKK